MKLINRKFISSFLLTASAVVFVFPVLASASNNNELAPQQYITQLKNSSDASFLNKNFTSVKQRFTNSDDLSFKNIFSFSSNQPLSDVKNELANTANYVEAVNSVTLNDISVQQVRATNDPGFTNNAQDIDKEWGLPKAGFDAAWMQTMGSFNNVVAVIDTGVDATHEDLQGIKWVDGFDFINKQAISGKINSDDNGHGTLVTGVLGATPNNGLGITGTNWQISIMPIKALDASGKGDSATIAEAIVWAVDHGAQFINLSIGGIGFGHDTTLSNAIAYAFNKNALLVSAAGNDAVTNGNSLDSEPVYPICDDNNANMVVGVAALDQNDTKPAFSNYGKNCIDVSAPGKRILSTINHDPISKQYSANAYAYASGTSLAVPFVVGQAALIKTLFPNATNAQIRDRIMSSADPVDALNLTQCNGSCQGLLGSGRIDVPKSLATVIATSNFNEGDLVKTSDTNVIYLISGGQKRPVSGFVMQQKFPNANPKLVAASLLSSLPDGPYVTPTDGTLAKIDLFPTVFYISQGQKFPITAEVFNSRKFNFSQVQTFNFVEMNSWPTANFLPPADGTLVRGAVNKTVYWVLSGTLHPINYNFYVDRGLNVFPILIVHDTDIAGFAKGESYIK